MSDRQQGLTALRDAVDAYRRAVDDGRGGGEWVHVWGGHIEALLAEVDALRGERDAARAEIAVTDKLLADRQRVLDAVPECPAHGPCVPFAIQWITNMKNLRIILDEIDEGRKHDTDH
jgi:hypothetical protein